MTELKDILPEVYGPITIALGGAALKFARHLAANADITLEELCGHLVMDALDREAREITDILNEAAREAEASRNRTGTSSPPPLDFAAPDSAINGQAAANDP
jgi:hypothetical protein